jgi:hypothetical protein
LTVSDEQLKRVERIVDTAGVCEPIEARLPAGVRARQLLVRTLLVGMLLAADDGRPAHLVRVHRALLALSIADQLRLGVRAQWRSGEHELTYRQVEYTFRQVARALGKPTPDGAPSEQLSDTLDRLLEASVTVLGEPASGSYAVDWTDLETWSRPPPKHATNHHPDRDGDPALTPPAPQQQPDAPQSRSDPDASWGRRTTNHPSSNETFYGYYLQAITTVKDEHGPDVPELVRRVHLASCRHDPPAQIVPVIRRMHEHGVKIKDLLADSGYSYRVATDWALPIRALGTQLIVDLHPNDRGRKGTHDGAIINNGRLYCPATPAALLQLSPLPPAATPEQTHAHDQHCQELARYKLAPLTGYDPDGYHRASCPAVTGKLRCPLKPESIPLAHDRPTIHAPPQHPPVCCTQQTITIPPTINAKTTQKHDYPSPQHRHSYARRTASERAFSSIKDPAANTLKRGNLRLTGLTPIALFTATTTIARNLRTHDAHNARQAENQRRATNGQPPKTRKRRRTTTTDLTTAANPPP